MSVVIPKMIPQQKLILSLLRLLFLTIPVKSEMDIAQFWIAILLILQLNLRKLLPRLIEELVRLLKNSQNSLRLVMLAYVLCYQANPCAAKFSVNIPLLEDLQSET